MKGVACGATLIVLKIVMVYTFVSPPEELSLPLFLSSVYLLILILLASYGLSPPAKQLILH